MDVGFRVGATSLDDIAAEAGVTRVILYRHFDSKTDLYQAVLDRSCGVLGAHVAEPVGGFTDARIDGMVQAAAAEQETYLQAIEPAGFTIDTLRVNAYAFLSDQAPQRQREVRSQEHLAPRHQVCALSRQPAQRDRTATPVSACRRIAKPRPHTSHG